MSLVAYGSSDESDSNDAEDAAPVYFPPATKVNSSSRSEPADGGGHISDEDEDLAYKPQQQTEDSDKNIGSLLRGLPAPRGPGQGILDETDELEDEVKPKAAELQDAPKPPSKKSKQPVKITIPALPDSDDDDGEPARKKLKPAAATSGKSGLTALLPAPMHAAKKEANRILLPYSLSKKPKQATSVQRPSAKHTTQTVTMAKNLTQYESDSDDDDDSADTGGNFFSLDTSKDSTTVGPSLKSPMSEASDSVNIPTVPLPQKEKTDVPIENTDVPMVSLPPTGLRPSLNLPAPQNKQTDSVRDKDSVSESEPMAGPVYGQPIDPNAPLTFKGGVSSQSYYQQAMSTLTSETGEEDGGSSNMYYNMPYDGTCSYPEVTDNEALRHDEEFLRLQGKKQRGKEEINIVDVNADDYTNPADLTKYLSEETEHRSQKKKDDQPTHIQKRKHQIQFLAFEAKERELELKNSWANNKMTKRQTQAKYGF